MSNKKLVPPRACEICGKNDIVTTVHSSSVGACSFNYCQCCDVVGAESKCMQEFDPNVVWYNSVDDKYYSGDKVVIPKLKNDDKNATDLSTRSSIAKFCQKAEPREQTIFELSLETLDKKFEKSN